MLDVLDLDSGPPWLSPSADQEGVTVLLPAREAKKTGLRQDPRALPIGSKGYLMAKTHQRFGKPDRGIEESWAFQRAKQESHPSS
jgi:hypothetical protein